MKNQKPKTIREILEKFVNKLSKDYYVDEFDKCEKDYTKAIQEIEELHIKDYELWFNKGWDTCKEYKIKDAYGLEKDKAYIIKFHPAHITPESLCRLEEFLNYCNIKAVLVEVTDMNGLRIAEKKETKTEKGPKKIFEIEWDDKIGFLSDDDIVLALEHQFYPINVKVREITNKSATPPEPQPCVASKEKYLKCDYSLEPQEGQSKALPEWCECEKPDIYYVDGVESPCNICGKPIKHTYGKTIKNKKPSVPSNIDMQELYNISPELARVIRGIIDYLKEKE